MGKGKKWVLLANAFDPTLMRNYLAFDTARELGFAYVPGQKITELWIDGAFRGCYTLMTPVQEGKDRVDIDIESSFFLLNKKALLFFDFLLHDNINIITIAFISKHIFKIEY